jgi:TrkA domain protein
MPVREVELPGVGKKYTLDTQSRDQVVVVLHRSGKREIYRFASEQSVPDEVIDLTTEEAQLLGGILSQTYFQPVPDSSRELVMKELAIDWLPLPEGHSLTGKSIREMAIRERTGASVIALLREGKAVINPGPEELFQPEDTIMIIGSETQVGNFKRTFQLPATESR